MSSLYNITLEVGGTDKGSHGYCPFYEKYINILKDKKIRLLEIGVMSGKSLEMWQKYFKNAEIHGIDIKDCAYPEKSYFHKLDVENENLVENFTEKNGNWDIIIDDGKHSMLSQQMTIKHLWNKLNFGGFYIIEDIHSSFMPEFVSNIRYEHTTHCMVKSLVDKKEFSSPYLDLNSYLEILKQTSYVEVFQRIPTLFTDSITSIIQKKNLKTL